MAPDATGGIASGYIKNAATASPAACASTSDGADADQTAEPLVQGRGSPAIQQTIQRVAERILDRLPPRRLSSLL